MLKQSSILLFSFLFSFLFLFLLVLSPSITASEKIDYMQDIQPVLKEKCFRCHDAKKQKSDLRMDTPKHMRAGGEGGPIFVPFQPEQSEMYLLTSLPEYDMDYMPSKGEGLTQSELELLKNWILQGALFGDEDNDTDEENGSKTEHKTPSTISSSQQNLTVKNFNYNLTEKELQALEKINQLGANIRQFNYDESRYSISFRYFDFNKYTQILPHLKVLKNRIGKIDFSRSHVTDKHLAQTQLGNYPNLQAVDIHQTDVSDSGIQYLASATKLEYLNLHNTGTSSASVKHLIALKSLKKLYLWNTRVTAKDVDSLREALPLVAIDLGGL